MMAEINFRDPRSVFTVGTGQVALEFMVRDLEKVDATNPLTDEAGGYQFVNIDTGTLQAEAVVGELASTIRMTTRSLTQLQAAGSGMRVIVIAGGPDNWASGLVVVTGPNGEAAVQGSCFTDASNQALHDFRLFMGSAGPVDGGEFVRTLLDPTSTAAAAYRVWYAER